MNTDNSTEQYLIEGGTLTKDFRSKVGSMPRITNYKREYLKTYLIWGGVVALTAALSGIIGGKIIYALTGALFASVIFSYYLLEKHQQISNTRRVETKMLKYRDFDRIIHPEGIKEIAEWFNRNEIYSSAFAGLNINDETETSLIRERGKDLFRCLNTYIDLPQHSGHVGWAERPYHLTSEGAWVGAERNTFNSIDFIRVDDETVRVVVKRCEKK